MRGLKMVVFAGATLLFVAIAGLLYAGQESSSPSSRPEANATTTRPASRPASEPATRPAKPQVVIDTNLGEIVVELDREQTPATVANFLRYVDGRFYDGIIFHRVIRGFMIQAGGITDQLKAKQPTHPPVINESRKGASNQRGTIAMARTSDPHSATSQFFINLGDNSRLDNYGGGYTVFGRVVKGMDVVDEIAQVPVRRTAISEAQPLENVVIRSIRRK